MPITRKGHAAVAIVAGLALSSCVSVDSGQRSQGPEQSTSTDANGQWVTYTLGPASSDTQIQGAALDEGMAILTFSEDDDVTRAFRLTAALTVEEAAYEGKPAELRRITAMTDGPAGVVAIGSDLLPDGRNVLLTSVHGDVWREPFRPVILMSTDGGTSWTQASIPDRAEGSVTDVAADESGLLAVASIDGDREAWRSVDGGVSWSVDQQVPAATQITSSGSRTIALESRMTPQTGEPMDTLLHRSDDRDTWQPADLAFHQGYEAQELRGDAQGFSLTSARSYVDVFSAPEVCYADLELCGGRESVDDEAIFLSDTGDSWRTLDLDHLAGLRVPSTLLRTSAGDTVVLGSTDSEWAAWVWDDTQGEPPTYPAEPQGQPIYDGPAFARRGGSIKEAERYAFPLHIHCGMDMLGAFNGSAWGLAESPSGFNPETGAGDSAPQGWPLAGENILGFITLVSQDAIEYSLEDGTVIAEYQPIPDDETLICS